MLESRDKGHKVVIFALDLDGFKAINDLFGHPAGDALLTGVARRLEAWTSSLDGCGMAARFGGDEFLILLKMEQSESAPEIAERLLQLFGTAIETSYGNLGDQGDGRICREPR